MSQLIKCGHYSIAVQKRVTKMVKVLLVFFGNSKPSGLMLQCQGEIKVYPEVWRQNPSSV